MNPGPEFNAELLSRYDRPAPRYTSYPTAPRFDDAFTVDDWRAALGSRPDPARPLSLYFHIPFCRSLCFYCACNKIITPNHERSLPYLDAIFRELELVAAELPEHGRKVSQIHLGGGTPTFLSGGQLADLMANIRRHFDLAEDGEYSIEIDPRACSVETIERLAELGFNRMSFGVQDFDPQVQKAVNRIQSPAETFAQIDAARAHGVESINLDLIYGLPLQNRHSFARTLDTVIEQRPDRVAVYSYAHLPEMFRAQRQIEKHQLPSASEKLALLELAIKRFLEAGYEYIGMDHFALPDDELAIARRDGSLQRNFQGYSTQSQCDMLGFGITSIGRVGDSYYQNIKTEKEYLELIEKGELPIAKGYSLVRDDRIRSEVIMTLMCQGELDIIDFESRTGITFYGYFEKALPRLLTFCEDGLVELGDRKITITPRGQLLLRNICQLFDAYHKPQVERTIIQSKAI